MSKRLRRRMAANREREDQRGAAIVLDAYMRERARVENVAYALTPEFYEGAMRGFGCTLMFGVQLDPDCRWLPVQDVQEPRPGFLMEFMLRWAEGGRAN